MSGNSVTGAIVRNKVVFDIDNKSYQKVLNRIKQLQKHMSKIRMPTMPSGLGGGRGRSSGTKSADYGSQGHIRSYQKELQRLEKAHARALALNKAFNLKQANAVQQQGKLHVRAVKYDSQRTDKLQNDIQRQGALQSKALRMNEQFDSKKNEALTRQHQEALSLNKAFDRAEMQRQKKKQTKEDLITTTRLKQRVSFGDKARGALSTEMAELDKQVRGGTISPKVYAAEVQKIEALAKAQTSILAKQHQEALSLNKAFDRAEMQRQKRMTAEVNNRRREKAKAKAYIRSREDIMEATQTRQRGSFGAITRRAMSGEMAALNQRFKAGSVSPKVYAAEVQKIEATTRRLKREVSSVTGAIFNMRNAFIAATASYTAFAGAKAVMQTGQLFQQIENGLLMASGNATLATDRMNFLRKEVVRLGAPLEVAAQGFTQMAVSAEGFDETALRSLFSGYSEYATTLGADQVKYERGIVALGQMLSKGQIMSEELKQQLSEALAGYTHVFVKAAKEYYKDDTITMSKLMDMMKAGKVKADLLKLVGKYSSEAARKGGALEKALNSNRVAMQRMNAAFTFWKDAIFRSGFEQGLTKIFNTIAHYFNVSTTSAGEWGNTIGKVFDKINSAIEYTVDSFMELGWAWDELMARFSPEQREMIASIASTLGGFLVATTVLRSLYVLAKLLAKITGMSGAFSSVIKTVGKIKDIKVTQAAKAATAAEEVAKGGASAATRGGSLLSKTGVLGKVLAPLALGAEGYDWLSSRWEQAGSDNYTQSLLNADNKGRLGKYLFPATQSTLVPASSSPIATYRGDLAPQQPQKVEVAVKIDTVGVKNLVTTTIEEREMQEMIAFAND